MANPTLTEAEVTCLKACLNYDTREAQLSDNYSNGDPDEFQAQLDWNMHQVGGVMTSLKEKNMGFYDPEDDIFWLTEDGVNTIFDLIEAEQRAA
jgi:hypothetical protein